MEMDETPLERKRRLGRERRARYWANKSEQELLNVKRRDAETRRKRVAAARLQRTHFSTIPNEICPCMHCATTEVPTTDINEIKFSENGQIVTLGECYALITGIKLEPDSGALSKICQMCQQQLINTYKFKKQFQQQIPLPSTSSQACVKAEVVECVIKEESEPGPTFSTVLLPDFQQEKKPVPLNFEPLPIELIQPNPAKQVHTEFRCEVCNKTFTTERSWKQHMNTIHAESLEKYICHMCGFQTIYKPMIRDHLMTHIKGYVCIVCEERFPNRILRKQHLQQKHIVSSVGAVELSAEDLGIKVQCTICGLMVFKTSMRSHLEIHSDKFLKCESCTRVFKNKKLLASHIWKAHQDSRPKNVVKCDLCPQIYIKEIYLDRHIAKVHSSNSAAAVKTHRPTQKRMEQRLENALECSYCPKMFDQQLYLNRHVAKVHTNDLKHRCDTCGNCYEKRSDLSAHKSTHAGDQQGKHECQYCHSLFTYSTGLFHHIKKQHPETCFKCPVSKCGETLASQNSLDHHGNIHATISAECMVCCEQFENFFALYDHYEIEHRMTKKIYLKHRQDNCRCECGKIFPSLNNLKFHIVQKPISNKHDVCRYCNKRIRMRKKKVIGLPTYDGYDPSYQCAEIN